MNRAARRARKAALRAQARRTGGTLITTDPGELLDRDAAGNPVPTPIQTMVERAVASAEKQIGEPFTGRPRAEYERVIRTNLWNLLRQEEGLPPVAAEMGFSAEQEAEAARLLGEMLPRARETVASLRRSDRAGEYLPHGRRPPEYVTPPGAVAPGVALHEALRKADFTADDIEGVFVYEATGQEVGWHGDVQLRREIEPFSNLFGTPVAHPLPTREEAVRAALGTLVSFLLVAEGDAA